MRCRENNQKRSGHCSACGGKGLFSPANPSCKLELLKGETLVERCDACEKFRNDLDAARSLSSGPGCSCRWVRCANGGTHAVIKSKGSKYESQ